MRANSTALADTNTIELCGGSIAKRAGVAIGHPQVTSIAVINSSARPASAARLRLRAAAASNRPPRVDGTAAPSDTTGCRCGPSSQRQSGTHASITHTGLPESAGQMREARVDADDEIEFAHERGEAVEIVAHGQRDQPLRRTERRRRQRPPPATSARTSGCRSRRTAERVSPAPCCAARCWYCPVAPDHATPTFSVGPCLLPDRCRRVAHAVRVRLQVRDGCRYGSGVMPSRPRQRHQRNVRVVRAASGSPGDDRGATPGAVAAMPRTVPAAATITARRDPRRAAAKRRFCSVSPSPCSLVTSSVRPVASSPVQRGPRNARATPAVPVSAVAIRIRASRRRNRRAGAARARDSSAAGGTPARVGGRCERVDRAGDIAGRCSASPRLLCAGVMLGPERKRPPIRRDCLGIRVASAASASPRLL